MANKIEISSKNIKPKINLNHNLYQLNTKDGIYPLDSICYPCMNPLSEIPLHPITASSLFFVDPKSGICCHWNFLLVAEIIKVCFVSHCSLFFYFLT